MSLRVINPFDGSTIDDIPFHGAHEVDAKIEAARASYTKWRETPLEDRCRIVRDGLEKFRAAGETIVQDVSRQMGKPLAESQGEFQTFFTRAEQALGDAASALAPEVVEESSSFSRRIVHEPLGVVLNLAAWNYPLLIPVNVIVPALLAGNVVLLKHSATTPLTGRAFAKAFGELECPNLVTDLVLQRDDVASVISDPRIDFLSFTGSVGGGVAVYQSAASRLLDAGLELGGNDPAYVAADADLDFAVANLVEGSCYNAGQSCCAVERVYVHRDLYEEFLERALPLISAYRLGDPFDEATTMGPLARGAAPAELQAQVDQAVAAGARLLEGGSRPADLGDHFYSPTLLADVPQDTEIMQEESFGPLLPLARVEDDRDAIARMNDSRFGLTASIWTSDSDRADWAAKQLEAGTIFQNRADYIDPALPWTGWKESGLGSSLSRFGFHQLTRRKAIHLRRTT